MKKQTIIIGTRGSELALWQANFIKSELKKIDPKLKIDLKLIKTKGDKILDVPLAKIGDKGLFTKELENELLAGSIDIAVHSLKDMETVQPAGLELAAITKRHDVRDVLIAKTKKTTVNSLPDNATVGTSSLRRICQLKHIRPDIQVVDLRGNVPTRIEKFRTSGWDAIILAAAGVERLKLGKNISGYLETDEFLPAAGQAALAVQIKSSNSFVKELLKPLNDKKTEIEVTAERSLLRSLEGGCQIPVGVFAQSKKNGLYLDAIVGSLDGSVTFRKKIRGSNSKPVELGKKLAKDLLKAGADKVLKEIRN